MSEIGPGDFVECVDNSPAWWSGQSYLVKGAIYQVEDLSEGPAPSGEWSANLREVGCLLRINEGWSVARFRPVYRPKASLIENLKVSERIGEGERSDVRANQKEVA